MRRKKLVHTHANHERWIVSYADFVTLLFAFFVVMFATANSDKGKVRAVSEAIKSALDQSESSKVQEVIREAFTAAEKQPPEAKKTLGELVPTLTLLQKQLRDEIGRGEVALRMEPRGLTISFKQAALFDSGEASLKGSSFSAMGKVANAMLEIPNQVRLEGHTDNVPIHTGHFQNNWELSSARSIAVLQVMTEKFNVPVRRLAVSGYADIAPVATNDTEEGRMKNRRVDIVILSMLASKSEPAKARAGQ